MFLPPLVGQTNYTISGYVKDSLSGEDLIGVNVYDKDRLLGATTNVYGFYSVTLPAGEVTLVVSYISYLQQEIKIDLQGDTRLNVNLEPVSKSLEEVVVVAERAEEHVETTEMSVVELKTETIKEIPALFGEVDILKAIQLLPGVQSAGEGTSGFYVRGGGPDQNLVLLDEAIVYNSGHLFGFFSVFNADAIKNTTLIKGGIPANYGGRLSSVLDIQMKEGNNRKFHADGGIGLIASRLTVEGPIVKERSSFMVSGRRTYADVLIKPFAKGTNLEGNAYYFYDLNAKVNYKFSDKDRLYLSGYFGRDVFTFRSASDGFTVDVPWGNSTATIRWNHLFNDKLFMNASAIYNDYNFETRGEQLGFKFIFGSGIRDVNVKTDFDYFMRSNQRVKFGVNYSYHIFQPSNARFVSEADSIDISTSVKKKYAHEGAAYLLYEWDIGKRLRLNTGLRYGVFQQVGPYQFDQKNDQGDVIDSIVYGRLEPVKTYHGPEPRLAIRLLLDSASSIKASVTSTNQYLHLVSNSSSTLPTDVWVPSSRLVEPQRAVQYAAGYFRNLFNNEVEASVEVYYKDLRKQLEYEDGYSPSLNEEIEESFVVGRGWSYGAELFIKKSKGRLTGWIGYTLSRTERKFDDINFGNAFPATYDRTHDLAVVSSYRITPRTTASATLVFGTGNTTTIPSSWFVIEGYIYEEQGPRNEYRLKPYHRLDLALTVRGKETAKLRSEWVFAVYNVYNRKNPYFIFFENEGSALTGDLQISAKQVSLFPIIPSITWNFRF